MKNRKSLWVQALVISGSVIFLSACHGNRDYTNNSANPSEPAGDTTMKTSPSNPDTAMNNSPSANSKMNSSTTPKKNMTGKKGKVTVGTMKTTTTSSMKPDKNGVYEMTDVKPSYPGGHTALASYINDNVEYPQDAIDNNSQGTVDVQFVVDQNGKVTDAKAIGKQLQNGLDDEAVKVVSNMPNWTPGKVKGKNVKTRMVLPITFKTEG
jgi:TonB family protein